MYVPVSRQFVLYFGGQARVVDVFVSFLVKIVALFILRSIINKNKNIISRCCCSIFD